MITRLIRQAVVESLVHALPFVLFALPGRKKMEFYACPPLPDGTSPAQRPGEPAEDGFFISFFDNDEPYTAGVPFRMDAAETLDYIGRHLWHTDATHIHPHTQGTRYVAYRESLSQLGCFFDACPDAKVVISRLICVTTSRSIIDIAERYFGCTSSTFRYLCFTPETGIWLGSTPELLLETGPEEGRIRTMALAGTLPADTPLRWDAKNLREQEIVTRYIASILREAGLQVSVSKPGEKRFLSIKHLCTDITASGEADIPELLRSLSPTPAVAGFPRDAAIAAIDLLENHSRYCYGGYVGVRRGGRVNAYVNLRCAFLSCAILDDNYIVTLCNLFVGGGILAESDPAAEWAETDSKAEALLAAIAPDYSDDMLSGPELARHSISPFSPPCRL